jgi:PIN domain nuclease of toxin-antitoxin system
MMGAVVLPDTHTLYWHTTGSNRISRPAREVFTRAAAGEYVLALSPIVLVMREVMEDALTTV